MADNGVKFSEFPSQTPDNADYIVGLHAANNAKFTVANFVAAIRSGLANLLVPQTRTVNGKALSADITLDADDVGAQAEITANGILKGDGAGGVSAAVEGTDYGTYSKPSSGIPATDLANGVIPSVPDPSDATPQGLGTAAAGSSADYSRADHIHQKPTPSDIGAQSQINSYSVLYGNGNGVITHATENVDYVVPSAIGTQENGATSVGNYAAGALFFRNGMLCRAITNIAAGDGFSGSNVEYASVGDTVALKANQSELATVESGTTASRAYLPGERFVWQGILHRAKTAIASGATFTVGTNCEATTVAAELGIPCEYIVPPATLSLLTDISGAAYRIGNVVVFAFQANTDGALATSTELLRIPNHVPSVNGQVFALYLGYTANTGRINGGSVSSISYARFYTNTAVSAGVKLTITGSYFIS